MSCRAARIPRRLRPGADNGESLARRSASRSSTGFRRPSIPERGNARTVMRDTRGARWASHGTHSASGSLPAWTGPGGQSGDGPNALCRRHWTASAATHGTDRAIARAGANLGAHDDSRRRTYGSRSGGAANDPGGSRPKLHTAGSSYRGFSRRAFRSHSGRAGACSGASSCRGAARRASGMPVGRAASGRPMGDMHVFYAMMRRGPWLGEVVLVSDPRDARLFLSGPRRRLGQLNCCVVPGAGGLQVQRCFDTGTGQCILTWISPEGNYPGVPPCDAAGMAPACAAAAPPPPAPPPPETPTTPEPTPEPTPAELPPFEYEGPAPEAAPTLEPAAAPAGIPVENLEALPGMPFQPVPALAPVPVPAALPAAAAPRAAPPAAAAMPECPLGPVPLAQWAAGCAAARYTS